MTSGTPQVNERFERLSLIVRGMAQGMRPADEDLVSEGLLELWRVLKEYPDKEDRFLIASARNALLDRLKYQRIRCKEMRLADVCGVEANFPGVNRDVRQPLELLDLLPLRVRRAVALHYLNDCTLDETAERMTISRSSVKRLLRRGRRILRKELE